MPGLCPTLHLDQERSRYLHRKHANSVMDNGVALIKIQFAFGNGDRVAIS